MVTESPTHFLHRRSRIYSLFGLVVLLMVIAVLATTIGSVKVPFWTTSSILLSRLPWVENFTASIAQSVMVQMERGEKSLV